jgi:Na+/H+ antiporter NhaA
LKWLVNYQPLRMSFAFNSGSGGMLVPAIIFVVIGNMAKGWGIPMATGHCL